MRNKAALANYINRNGLYITQYQEYGWAPVPVLNAPPTREEDQEIHYTGRFDYKAQFDMREICAHDDCNVIRINICKSYSQTKKTSVTEAYRII